VSVGNLRVAVLAAASPLLLDAVVCGHDGDYVGLLAWLDLRAAREVVGDPEAEMDALVRSCAVADVLRERLAAYNVAHPASSTRVERVLLLEEPPQLDANEITDKGYVNQRAVLTRRADRVQALFAGDEPVITVP
jgi:feruloyl-CoA synthase